MITFHGTTLKNYVAIRNGQKKESFTWKPSNDPYIYLYPLPYWPRLASVNEYHIQDEDACIVSCFFQAMVTSCVHGGTELVVLKLDTPEDILEPDISCGGMAAKAVRTKEDINPYIEEVYIKTNNDIRAREALAKRLLLTNPYINLTTNLQKMSYEIDKYADHWKYETIERPQFEVFKGGYSYENL